MQAVDAPRPALSAGEVRVRVIEVGVCGTDRDIVAGRYGRAPAGAPFLILGHENLGEVAEAASGVTGLSVGDPVVATVRRGCGECRFCAVGRSDFCETGRFTERGIAGAHGYFAEEYVERPAYLVTVPRPLLGAAVLLEPMSVAEKAIEQGEAVLNRKEPTPGHPRAGRPVALVAGTGAVGMLTALVLRVRGYDVTAIDRHGATTPAAARLAEIGAEHVDAAGGLSALGGRQFDLIVEATGSIALDLSLVDRLGPNGVLVLTGIPDAAAPPASVAAGSLLREVVLGNRAIVGSVNANRSHFEAGLRDLAESERRWPGVAARLISARRPLAEYHDVLTAVVPGATKTVLTFRPEGGGVR